MAAIAFRLSIRGRPPLGLGSSGESSDSICSQSESGIRYDSFTSLFAIAHYFRYLATARDFRQARVLKAEIDLTADAVKLSTLNLSPRRCQLPCHVNACDCLCHVDACGFWRRGYEPGVIFFHR